MFRLSYIVSWLFLAPLAVLAVPTALHVPREYLVNVWRTDEGLPQNWVSSIAQTPDGYLWIGTRYGGLARFDGVRFVTFGPQNTPQLQDVQVEHLSVDAHGRLWVIMGNESVTCVEHNRFTLHRQPRAEPQVRVDRVLRLSGDDVLFAGERDYIAKLHLPDNRWSVSDPRPDLQVDAKTLLRDAEGTVWCVTEQHQLARYQSGRFELVAGPREPIVGAVVSGPGQHLWVATAHQILEYVSGTDFVDRTPVDGPLPEAILQLASCPDGSLWVLERARLRKYRHGRWDVTAAPMDLLVGPNPAAPRLYGDGRGDLWAISEGRGLWHVEADGAVSKLTQETGLPSFSVTCWFEDAEGNIWVGTNGNGLARIRKSYFHVFGQNQGLPGTAVSSVCVTDEGDVLAGTVSGSFARLHNGRYTAVALPVMGGKPPTNVAVLPAVGGGAWVGSINQGLLRWKNGAFARMTSSRDNIRVLFGDSRGRLWGGGLVGAFYIEDGRMRRFSPGDRSLRPHAIGAIAEGGDGAIWIGTGPGDLWKYAGGAFTRFTPPAEWSSVRFSAVLPDRNGVVWIGTLGGGLLRFEAGRFTRCTRADGLPNDNISQLLDSEDGYLWAGTYGGIFRVAKDDLANFAQGRSENVPVQVYGRFDGLHALECSSGSQPACWRSADGRLYFSTAEGVVIVNPKEVPANKVPPRAIIEELLIDGKQVDMRRAADAAGVTPPGPLEIGPGRHYVQFRFTGLNFTAPDAVRFRVKLAGAERQWQSIGDQRLIGYGPLPPGDFRFEVLACNNGGVWSAKPDTLSIRVLPSFWETWWFKAGVAVLALAVLAVAQRRRYQRRLQALERQGEIERERARIARDLHDDLGTSLTQISLLSAVANREQTAPAEARELVQLMHGRARAMAAALDEIVWAVNPKNDSWPELASYLGAFAQEFLRPSDLRCRLDLPEQLPSDALSAEIRHDLFLAFKEALNNAVRHSGAAYLHVSITVTAAEVVIAIKDDGRGFDRSAVPTGRTGNGLLNMQRRLEQLGGRCAIQSDPGRGTTIALHVPRS